MRLVGGVVGAVIGAYFGNPYAGYAIGSMIGGVIEGPQKFKQEGQRLTDNKVTNSSYSIGIPIYFGTYRGAGNVIRSTVLKETKNVETQEQGKGASAETETTTYTYRITIAYLLSEGVISGMSRIWYNGKLIYDYTQNNTGFIGDIGGNIKIYYGTEEQLPDPSLEAEFGVGDVTAYRGRAYVVFNDLQLKEFNNQVPQFQFEVIRSKDNVIDGKYDFFTDTELNTGYSGYLTYNKNNRFVYGNLCTNGDNFNNIIFKIDPFNNEIISKNNTGYSGGTTNGLRKVNILQSGDLLVTGIKTAGDGTKWTIIDQDTLQVKAVFDYLNLTSTWASSGGYTGASFRAPPNIQSYIENGITFYVSCSNNSTSGFQIFRFVDDGSYPNFKVYDWHLPTANTSSVGLNIKSSLVYDNLFLVDNVNKDVFYTLCTNNYHNLGTTSAIVLSKYNFNSNLITDEFKLLVSTPGSGGFDVNQMYFDKVTRNIYLVYTNTSTSKSYILKYNVDTDTILYNNVLFDGVNYPSVNTNNSFIDYDDVLRRIYINYNVGTNYYVMYYKIDNDVVEVLDYTNNSVWGTSRIGACSSAYVSDLGCEIYLSSSSDNPQKILKNYGPRYTKGTYPLSDAVSELIALSKLDTKYIDVSELEDDVINGYMISNPASIRTCIDVLARAYNFEMVESNFKIKFKKNGKNPVATIKFSELSAVNYSPDVKFETDLTTERKQELELPKIINLSYSDIDRDYQTSTVESKIENVYTNEIVNIELPMAFTSTQAKQIADRILYNYWVNRDTYTFNTTYKYLDIEPCDIITIIKDDGSASFTMKIVKKEKGGGIIKWTAVAEDSAVFTQISTAESGSDISQTIPALSTSKLFFLDIPMLQNTDNDPGVYVASVRQNTGLSWSGSTLYVSDQSDGNYLEQASFFNEVVAGNTTTILDDFLVAYNSTEGNYNNFIDNFSSVTVKLFKGTLTSITEDQLSNGYNMCLIENEVLQFKNANLIDTNTYQLTGFYRARFGTDQFVSNHQVGDRFVMLNSSSKTIQRVLKDQSQLNILRYFKNVTFKDKISNTVYNQFMNTGVSLKPYSVNNISGYRDASNNLTVQFTKRVRGWSKMVDWQGAYDPDGDSYEIEIFTDSTFTTVKRLITTTSKSFVYGASDQILDFGAVQSTVYIKIYKMNAIVGRGYSTKITL